MKWYWNWLKGVLILTLLIIVLALITKFVELYPNVIYIIMYIIGIFAIVALIIFSGINLWKLLK